MLTHLHGKVAAALLLALSAGASGQNIPKGFSVPQSTLSPDHRYGVTVPILDEAPDTDATRNSVIEMKTGRLVVEIHAYTGWNRMNHGGVLPSRWSPDGSLLLWEVEGKWCPLALVLLKIEKGRLIWQADVLKAAQQAILARTKIAEPQKYAAAKKDNEGNGSAYPEGFTIDVHTDGEDGKSVLLPLVVHADLTSDPKEISPPILEAQLDGVVHEDGTFTVTHFKLARRATHQW